MAGRGDSQPGGAARVPLDAQPLDPEERPRVGVALASLPGQGDGCRRHVQLVEAGAAEGDRRHLGGGDVHGSKQGTAAGVHADHLIGVRGEERKR